MSGQVRVRSFKLGWDEMGNDSHRLGIKGESRVK